MDDTDYALLKELQKGLPLVPEPFRKVAENLALTEYEVLERVKTMMGKGIIRKFRARIDQRQAGITANALVAWRIDPPAKNTAARILASSRGVTHCYERKPVRGVWDYTLYTVHHGQNRRYVLEEVSSIARTAGLTDYIVLFSTQEFKRIPAVRIQKGEGDPA